MNTATSKAVAKPSSSKGSVPPTRGGKPKADKTRTDKTLQYRLVLNEVEKAHGVNVAAAPKPTPNPYAMTAKRARELAEKAGIITKAGNLTLLYK